MTVIRDGAGWAVVNAQGETVQSGFASQSDAWRWIDRHDADALAMDDTRRRIQTAFADR